MPKFPSRQVVLSFITGNGCTPTWNGTPLAQATAINTRIQQTQALSDQVIASFGGKTGPEPAVSCSDPTQLAASYQTVVSRYNLSTIDLDIEGSASLNSTVNARRAVAIATVQKAQAKAGRGLAVWLTLAVTPSGLLPDSLAVVQEMMSAGVTISGVNVMTLRLRASGRPDGAQRQRERPHFHCSADPVSRASTRGPSWARRSWKATPTPLVRCGTSPTPKRSGTSHTHTVLDACPSGRSSATNSAPAPRRQPSNSCSGVTQQLQQFSAILGKQPRP